MLKKLIVSAVLPVFMLMLALPVSAEDVISDAPSVAPDLGQEANIITVSLKQQSAKAGEAVAVSVMWYPIGEYQVSSSKSKDAKPLSANLSITDGAGNFCADPVWKTVFSEYREFSLSAIATRDCDRLYARIALIDADKKLLDAVDITTDEKMIATPEAKTQEMQPSDEAGLLGNLSPMFRLAIIVVGAITLVGLVAILGRNIVRRRSVITILLPFLLAVSMLAIGDRAEAATSDIRAGGVSTVMGTATMNTDKTSYAPGENMTVYGSFSVNFQVGLACPWQMSAKLNTEPLFPNNYTFLTTTAWSGSGQRTLPAPATPGTYTIDARIIGGCYAGYAGNTILTITVEAAPVIPGICGTANGGSFSTAPSSSLCVTGTASWTDNTAADNIFNWNCVGSNGGITTSCMANKTTSIIPVNGVCGSSNGGTFAAAPSSNLCATGTPSYVYDYGFWSWTCAGSGGGTTAICSANKASVVPTISFYPDTYSISGGTSTNLHWTATNATSCTASGSWSGAKAVSGTESTGILSASQVYFLSCTGPGGTSPLYTVPLTVIPVISSTLKACLNACNSGSSDFNGQTISLAPNDTRRLAVCYNSAPGCTDASGDITASAMTTFAANNTPSDAVTPTATKGEFSANSVPTSRTESVSIATVSGNASVAFSVAPVCASNCSTEGGDHCTGESFQTKDSCGTTETCTGTRYCDFNWKEVAP